MSQGFELEGIRHHVSTLETIVQYDKVSMMSYVDNQGDKFSNPSKKKQPLFPTLAIRRVNFQIPQKKNSCCFSLYWQSFSEEGILRAKIDVLSANPVLV